MKYCPYCKEEREDSRFICDKCRTKLIDMPQTEEEKLQAEKLREQISKKSSAPIGERETVRTVSPPKPKKETPDELLLEVKELGKSIKNIEKYLKWIWYVILIGIVISAIAGIVVGCSINSISSGFSDLFRMY